MWVPVSFDALQHILDFAYGTPIFNPSSSSSSSRAVHFFDPPSADLTELIKGSRFFKLESLTRACDHIAKLKSDAELEREKSAPRRIKGFDDDDDDDAVAARRKEESLVQVPVISSGAPTTTGEGEISQREDGESEDRRSKADYKDRDKAKESTKPSIEYERDVGQDVATEGRLSAESGDERITPETDNHERDNSDADHHNTGYYDANNQNIGNNDTGHHDTGHHDTGHHDTGHHYANNLKADSHNAKRDDSGNATTKDNSSSEAGEMTITAMEAVSISYPMSLGEEDAARFEDNAMVVEDDENCDILGARGLGRMNEEAVVDFDMKESGELEDDEGDEEDIPRYGQEESPDEAMRRHRFLSSADFGGDLTEAPSTSIPNTPLKGYTSATTICKLDYPSATVSRTRDLNRELDEELDGSFFADEWNLDPEKLVDEDLRGFDDVDEAMMTIRPEMARERTLVLIIDDGDAEC